MTTQRVTTRRVQVEDAEFRVSTSTLLRAGARRRAVLVHGIGTSHRYFRRLREDLQQEADVAVVDLPGFGGLPKPGDALSIDRMGLGLDRTLEEAGLEDVVLVGHSMGAQWVVELAVRRPDLIAAVVLIGAVTDRGARSLSAQGAALAFDTLGESPSANRLVLLDYLRCGPVWFLRQSRHMLRYPIEDRVAELDVPLLVIRGGDDPISGARWNRLLRDRAVRGRMVQVPGHRHLVQYTAPRAVAAAIRHFVRTEREVVDANGDARS